MNARNTPLNGSEVKERRSGVFVTGDRVDLTVLSERDVLESNWYDWFNDEETTSMMQSHYYPNSREAQLRYLREEILGNASRFQLGIRDKVSRTLVGIAALQQIDLLNRKAEVAVIIGEKKYRNISVFLEVEELLIRHAFETLNLNRVYLGSISTEIVEFMCRSLGFRREGTRRQDVFKNGRYVDVYICALLKEEWQGGRA